MPQNAESTSTAWPHLHRLTHVTCRRTCSSRRRTCTPSLRLALSMVPCAELPRVVIRAEPVVAHAVVAGRWRSPPFGPDGVGSAPVPWRTSNGFLSLSLSLSLSSSLLPLLLPLSLSLSSPLLSFLLPLSPIRACQDLSRRKREAGCTILPRTRGSLATSPTRPSPSCLAEALRAGRWEAPGRPQARWTASLPWSYCRRTCSRRRLQHAVKLSRLELTHVT